MFFSLTYLGALCGWWQYVRHGRVWYGGWVGREIQPGGTGWGSLEG